MPNMICNHRPLRHVGVIINRVMIVWQVFMVSVPGLVLECLTSTSPVHQPSMEERGSSKYPLYPRNAQGCAYSYDLTLAGTFKALGDNFGRVKVDFLP